jgi:hypothetical protein
MGQTNTYSNIDLINLDLAPQANTLASTARGYRELYEKQKAFNIKFDKYWGESNLGTHAVGFFISTICSIALGIQMYSSLMSDILFNGISSAPWYYALVISGLVSILALLASNFCFRSFNVNYIAWKISWETENGISPEVSRYNIEKQLPPIRIYAIALVAFLLLITTLLACQRYIWKSDTDGSYDLENLALMLLAVVSVAVECFTGETALLWAKRYWAEIKMDQYYIQFKDTLRATAQLDKRIATLVVPLTDNEKRLLMGDTKKCVYRALELSTESDDYTGTLKEEK